MAAAAHDGLRALEVQVLADRPRHRRIDLAGQHGAELRLAERLEVLGVTAAADVDRELLGTVDQRLDVERVAGGEGRQQRAQLVERGARAATRNGGTEIGGIFPDGRAQQARRARLTELLAQLAVQRQQDLALDLDPLQVGQLLHRPLSSRYRDPLPA